MASDNDVYVADEGEDGEEDNDEDTLTEDEDEAETTSSKDNTVSNASKLTSNATFTVVPRTLINTKTPISKKRTLPTAVQSKNQKQQKKNVTIITSTAANTNTTGGKKAIGNVGKNTRTARGRGRGGQRRRGKNLL